MQALETGLGRKDSQAPGVLPWFCQRGGAFASCRKKCYVIGQSTPGLPRVMLQTRRAVARQ